MDNPENLAPNDTKDEKKPKKQAYIYWKPPHAKHTQIT